MMRDPRNEREAHAAMAKAPCAQCPFVVGSQMAYDVDAAEALDLGCIPSCHMVVGSDSVFAHSTPTEKQRCAGHDRWIAGDRGFRRPHELPSVIPCSLLGRILLALRRMSRFFY